MRQGEICLLMGASGSGKTTLLRQLAFEDDLMGTKEGILCRHTDKVGYVWQDPENQIVTDSVLYEIAFGMENMGIDKDLMRRRLAEIVTAFGLEDMLNAHTMSLSGGEKQILNIVSSLAMDPDLLLLDEPTSELDPVATKRLYDFLRQVNDEYGITIIIAEQHLDEIIPIADRIVCMNQGSIILDCDPYEVCERVTDDAILDLFPDYMKIAPGIISKKEARMWFSKHYESVDASVKTVDNSVNVYEEVEFSHLYFRYEKKGKDILTDCSGHFAKGSITCLVGGNGCGKTTLLKVLMGRMKAYRGRVRNMTSYAYLPQEPRYLLLEDTVADEYNKMTKYGKQLYGEFELTSLSQRHPMDISGGERQRLALCHVLGMDESIYILDEPTTGLDVHIKRHLGDTLRSICDAGCTVIIVTHDMEFAASYGDEIAFMFQGGILCHTGCREFFYDNKYYTTSINCITRQVDPHIITMEDISYYAKEKD